MEKILIIGLPGSGKSTFANKLGKKLNREVIHLDKIYYQSGWKHVQTKDEWRETVKNLISKEQWIMDGNYRGTLDMRLEVADTIIFLNFNKLLCLYGVFRRIFNRTQPFDKAEGNLEHISWNLMKKIILFSKKEILKKLENCRNSKKIFIVGNRNEADKLLLSIL